MRFFFQILVIVAIGFFLELFLPWWSIAIASFIGGLAINSKHNFLAGLISIGFLWIAKALITDLSSDSPLADQVADIFMLQNKALLLIVTFLVGGIAGGFSSMTGGALRKKRVKASS